MRWPVLATPGVVMALALFVFACSTSNPIGPGGTQIGTGSGGSLGRAPDNHGTVTALIDGVLYTGTIVAVTSNRTTFSIVSKNNDETVSLNFTTAPAVGTHNVTTSNDVQLQVITSNGRVVTGTWVASRANGGTGMLNIWELGSSSAAGSFDFFAPPSDVPRGSAMVWKAVSNGRFDATF